MGKRSRAVVSIIALCAGFASPLCAVPSFRGMISAKKGMMVNCTLCHLPDSWELNGYGKEFLKAGHTLAAVELLDASDPDKDGFLSKDEWSAGSNPGDPASTPKRPGPWLKEAKTTFPPKKVLAPLFPQGIAYRVHEEALPEPLQRELDKLLDRKLADDERYPTFFWVEQNRKPIGVASYAMSLSGKELNVWLVVSDGVKVLKVHPQHAHSPALKKKDFLKQFDGKSDAELSALAEQNKSSPDTRALIDAVRRALVIMRKVFP